MHVISMTNHVVYEYIHWVRHDRFLFAGSFLKGNAGAEYPVIAGF